MDNTLVAGIGGAILGAIANTYLNEFLSRPRVRVDIHDVLLSIPQWHQNNIEKDWLINDFNFFEVDESVINTFNLCNHVISPKKSYDTPLQYMKFLLEAYEDLNTKEFQYKHIPDVLKELDINLKLGDTQAFLEIWHKYYEVFWQYIVTGYMGRQFEISKKTIIEILANANKTEVTENIAQNEDEVVNTKPNINQNIEEIAASKSLNGDTGDKKQINFDKKNNCYFILTKSNKRIYFDTLGLDNKDFQGFCATMVYGLDSMNIDLLKDLVEFLKTVKWKDPYFNILRETIEKELNGFKKIVINGMIINTGGSAIAVSGKGVFNIESKGYKFRTNQYNQDMVVIPDDISIKVHIADIDKNDIKNAIIVDPGQAIPFEAHSCNYFRDFKEDLRIQLQNLYNVGQNCNIEFIRLDSKTIIKSNDIKYRDLNDDYFSSSKNI